MCLFEYVTNLKCPLCGFTRSISYLLDLDFYHFFYYNLISIFLIFVFTSLILNRKLYYPNLTVLTILTFGIIRNLSFYPFY